MSPLSIIYYFPIVLQILPTYSYDTLTVWTMISFDIKIIGQWHFIVKCHFRDRNICDIT